MVNKVILVGNLGKDPKAIGNAGMVSFSIATTENWKDKEGTKQSRTTWHNIIVFDKLADICQTYLRKGKQVYIEGRIQQSDYLDKETGEKKYRYDIVANTMQMLGSKSDNVDSPQGEAPQEEGDSGCPF